jgi:dTDP-4-dehydrorhamnose reductase
MKTLPPLRAGWIESIPGPVLVTGAKGMLGWEWSRALTGLGAGARLQALGREALDVTSDESVRKVFESLKPSLVIHCAAYTNVDRAETEREAARLANALSPKLIAEACRSVGADLVHYGTDQVFDGTATTPRKESDTPSPANHYAATKWEGEKAALSYDRALVVRVQWLYGERKDRFTPLKDKALFTPFSDQIGAPTWTRDIVEVTLRLLERKATGLYHLSYDDFASWAEVFGRVKEKLGYGVRLEPKRTKDFNLPAARPLFSVLDNRKIREALGVARLGSWKESLDEFLTLVGRPVGAG